MLHVACTHVACVRVCVCVCVRVCVSQATYSILVAKKPKHQPVLSPRTPAAAAAEAGTAPAATAQPASGSQPAQPAAATGVPAALQ